MDLLNQAGYDQLAELSRSVDIFESLPSCDGDDDPGCADLDNCHSLNDMTMGGASVVEN